MLHAADVEAEAEELTADVTGEGAGAEMTIEAMGAGMELAPEVNPFSHDFTFGPLFNGPLFNGADGQRGACVALPMLRSLTYRRLYNGYAAEPTFTVNRVSSATNANGNANGHVARWWARR